MPTATQLSPEAVSTKPEALRFHHLPSQRTLPKAAETWTIDMNGRSIGFIKLDPSAVEFDTSLREFGPAIRFHIDSVEADLAVTALRRFIAYIKTRLPYRVLTASCPANDHRQTSVLESCGFMQTGCRTRKSDESTWRQMVILI